MRHYRHTFRDHHKVNKLEHLVGFNASFVILKGIKSRANVFKCGRKTEMPCRKNHSRFAPFADRTEIVWSSECV